MKNIGPSAASLIYNRIKEINKELQEMDETYEGCDWCCGGGADEWKELMEEREKLVAQLVENGLTIPQLYNEK